MRCDINVVNDQIRIKPQITVSEEHKTTVRQLPEAVLASPVGDLNWRREK